MKTPECGRQERVPCWPKGQSHEGENKAFEELTEPKVENAFGNKEKVRRARVAAMERGELEKDK